MFYAIRHGETDNNKLGIVQGAGTNSSLNENGIKQAKELAERLTDLEIALIYSSDMLRAMQTTEVINEKLKLDIFYTPLIRETHYGEIEGMKILDVDLDKRYKDICLQVDDKNNPLRHDVYFPGGESRNMVTRRFVKCLSYIDHKDKNILLSTHGGILRSLACIHGGLDQKIPNCGGLYFNINPDGIPVDIEVF